MYPSKMIKPHMISDEPSKLSHAPSISTQLKFQIQALMFGDLKEDIVSFDPGYMDVVLEINFYSRIKRWIAVIIVSVIFTSLLSQPWFFGNLFLLSDPSPNSFLRLILLLSFIAILISTIAIILHYLYFYQTFKKSADHSAYINLEYYFDSASDELLENNFGILYQLFEEIGFKFQLLTNSNKITAFTELITITLEYTLTDIIISPPEFIRSIKNEGKKGITTKGFLIEFFGVKDIVKFYWKFISDILQEAFSASLPKKVPKNSMD